MSYQPKQLSSLWVITKNGSIVSDEELGQENSFAWLALAEEVIEDMPKQQIKTIVTDISKLEIKK